MDDGGAFDVPAGVAGAAPIVPAHGVVFAWADEFPEGEVAGVAFSFVEGEIVVVASVKSTFQNLVVLRKLTDCLACFARKCS